MNCQGPPVLGRVRSGDNIFLVDGYQGGPGLVQGDRFHRVDPFETLVCKPVMIQGIANPVPEEMYGAPGMGLLDDVNPASLFILQPPDWRQLPTAT